MAKIVVISKDKEFVLTTFEIMPPYFEGLNNGQKLTVVNFVSSFS